MYRFRFLKGVTMHSKILIRHCPLLLLLLLLCAITCCTAATLPRRVFVYRGGPGCAGPPGLVRHPAYHRRNPCCRNFQNSTLNTLTSGSSEQSSTIVLESMDFGADSATDNQIARTSW